AKKRSPPAVSKIRFECFGEGLSAQVMHVGPFSEEGSTVKRLHDFIEQSGYRLCGKHHEIYLSDIRKVAPERMKTVIRQPISR
ncbi:MAG TPA: GyrI-like domain-containing protein, partial [Methanocellaceae archaeon]